LSAKNRPSQCPHQAQRRFCRLPFSAALTIVTSESGIQNGGKSLKLAVGRKDFGWVFANTPVPLLHPNLTVRLMETSEASEIIEKLAGPMV